MPNPNDAHHAKLEHDVAEFLKQRGFFLPPAPTYHENWPPELVQLIAARQSMTALYLRTRADRLAIHRLSGVEFEWECKSNQRHADLSFEALPFLHHLSKSKLGVRCLLCIRNLVSETDHGLWVDDGVVGQIREVRVPQNCHMDAISDFMEACRRALPEVRVMETRATAGGSNDPFIVIDKKTAEQIPDWRLCVNVELNRAAEQN